MSTDPFAHLLALIWRPEVPLLPRAEGFWPKVRRFGQFPLAIIATIASAAAYNNIREPGQALLIAVCTAAPLLLVGRRSLLAWSLSATGALVFGLLVDAPFTSGGVWPWNPVQPLVLLFLSFVVGLRHKVTTLVAVWAATWFVVWSTVENNALSMFLLFSLPIVIGGVIGRYFKLGQRLAAEKERGGVLTERARIARELHDVVAHHMSMIAVRAETAPYRLPDVGEASRAEFTEISSAAREALTEMRLLLGVLRSDEASAPPTAPQPQITDLPDLVASARHAGAEVELEIAADVGEVPQIVGVSVYRIVQEALSNVARHAPGSSAKVTVATENDTLRVRVVNGPGTRASAGGGSGYGLRGAGERATILGGSLESGPTPSGGYEVDARLPVREA